VQYTTKRTRYGGLVLVERVAERIFAQDYIQKNVGINVTIADSIYDVIAAGLKNGPDRSTTGNKRIFCFKKMLRD
jgi:hypothetical protein